MPRKADILFLKLAVKNRILTEDTARGVVDFLDRSERSGHPSKARYVCVERGLLDERTAKQLKRHVKEYLEKQAEVSTNGRQIGNYFVEQKLGAGAMGIVYKAKHVKLGRPVALKLLLPEFAQDDVYIERFEREARAAAQLNHPNIVQCFDAGQEDDLVYIAMEYVDGKTMKDLIAEKGRVPESEAVKLVIQVARALEHAAAAGLIHRDVKPANIMFTKDGTAKLLDLGLAKKIENQENSELTGIGHAIGTPYYMAPEQALEEQVDHRADIYALGCTFYTAVVGEPPYKAATPTGVLAKHLNDPIPSVRKSVPEASLGLERVLTKMLAKKPAERYQKHETLVRDLEDVLAGLMPDFKKESAATRPVVGVTDGPRQRHQRTSLATASGTKQKGIGRPKPSGGGLGYVMGGLAACGAIVVFLGTQRPSKGKDDPHPTSSGSPRPGGTGDDGLPGIVPEDKKPDPAATPLPENKAARETAAKRQLDQIHNGNAMGWDLWRALDTHARVWTATRAGETSRGEADTLSGRLDGSELLDLQSQAGLLERTATEGDLLAAAAGYRKLAESFHGEHSIAKAKDRAAALESQAQQQAAKADEDSKALADAGNEADAVKLLKASLKLRREPKPTLDRIADLERRAAAHLNDAAALALEKDRVALQNLEVELRKDVKARKLDRASAACTEALAQLTGEAALARATAHKANLAQLADLERLAVQAFAGAKGQPVQFGSIEGTVKASGPGGVTVDIRQGVQATVPFTDIEEKLLVRQVRKAKLADDAQCNRFLALAKLYRGDEDAATVIALTKDAALAELAKQVDASNGVGLVVAGGPSPQPDSSPAATPPAHPGPTPAPTSAPQPSPTGNPSLPGNKAERDNFINDNIEKVFLGATRAYYSQNGFTAFYDFTVPNRNFGGLWKLESGEANPTPAGRTERRGLILASSEGRVVFDVPFMGVTSQIKVRFESFATLKDTSRLTLVLADTKKGDRYSSSFGALVSTIKGKKPKAIPAPDNLGTRITTNIEHSLELNFKDGRISTRLDDEETGSLAGVGIGEQKLSIEWVDTTLNIHQVDIIGYPTNEYVQKATGTAKSK